MSQATEAPAVVGTWTGTVTYEGKVDAYTVTFDADGSVELTTEDSTGTGSWTTTGPDTVSWTLKEEFKRDESGNAPAKVIPGAAYIEISIESTVDGDTFNGAGTAQICTAQGHVIHATRAETSGRKQD
jgi:hypothetical protein